MYICIYHMYYMHICICRYIYVLYVYISHIHMIYLSYSYTCQVHYTHIYNIKYHISVKDMRQMSQVLLVDSLLTSVMILTLEIQSEFYTQVNEKIG